MFGTWQAVERLRVGVHGVELHAIQSFRHHAGHGIASAAAHANHLHARARARFFLEFVFEIVESHESLPLNLCATAGSFPSQPAASRWCSTCILSCAEYIAGGSQPLRIVLISIQRIRRFPRPPVSRLGVLQLAFCDVAEIRQPRATGQEHSADQRALHPHPAQFAADNTADAADIPGGAEVVGFASWREGLMVRPGTRVRGLDDVARQGLRLVNREPGAQARALLDRERLRFRLDPAELPGYDSRAAGHLQVAAAIVGGLADAGVSSEPAALAYGLDFIPLAAERFDLVLPAKHAASREVQGLLRVLTSPWLLAQLASLAGYDAGRCGERAS